MGKKYKKIFNDDGYIEYVEDPDGKYTENDFKGEFVIEGKKEKSQELKSFEKQRKEYQNVTWVFLAIAVLIIIISMVTLPDDNEYNPTPTRKLTKEDCARMYPPVESEDVISDNILYLNCLDNNDLIGK